MSGQARDLGDRIVTALGEPASRELLDQFTHPEAYCAALIGRLYARQDATWLAEMLTDIESDPGVDALTRDPQTPSDLAHLPTVLYEGEHRLVTLFHDAELHQHGPSFSI